ncbi:FadR/GntR family transcriptional regulator [Phenylobacterium sp.]|uniref:FadR/GntR family transcriptional regulator n=1 Tax=Phenylobacterium sp. TaxID=1871053 RepID=UPI0027243B33|nr:FCD domain-containing protein [Phenylobacterium sp.]MDO8380298.1 FCD domain-containing protein [Phenylobacterium sp.]
MKPLAASMAARLAGPEAKAGIAAALDRMKAGERGEDDPLESDIAFHVAILRASGNRFLTQMRDLIDVALRTSFRLTNRREGARLASVSDHQRVAEAILAGDAEAASQAMRKLMLKSTSLIESAASE